tara:strand:- start:1135 stop:1626 length:492 start_codon:yes stop_codon:yes gene_type:complete
MTTMITTPSLKNLYDFLINDFNNLSGEEQQYFDIKTFDVIEYYIFGQLTGALHGLLKLRDSNLEIAKKTPQKDFYLGGHIKMSSDKPITQIDIDNVQKKINATDMSQCWGMEIYSVMEHNSRFETFKKFYNNYIEYINHKLYQPGGAKYFETMDHFNDSLKQI